MTAQATVPIPLGRLVMTAGVAELVGQRPALAAAIGAWIGRHAVNDCPNLDAHDRAANDAAIRDGDRVLTAWTLADTGGDGRLWIITEADRSSTCVLFPSEY